MDEADSQYWIHVDSLLGEAAEPSTPKPAALSAQPTFAGSFPTKAAGFRSAERTREILLLVVLALFLLDTFLPWQRACVGFGAFGFRFGGCLSANAWSGSAPHAGQAAGLFAILALGLIAARIGGVDLGAGGRLAARVGVYGTALAGILKWLAVVGTIPGFGSWLVPVLL